MTLWWTLVGLAVVGVAIYAAAPKRAAVIVNEWEHALLYIDGRFERLLPPGRHWIWKPASRRAIQRLSSREQIEVSAPVEVLTSDRFSARVAATTIYRITDPRSAFENSFRDRLRVTVGEALVQLAGARTLESLLTERAALGEELTALVAPKAPECELTIALSTITLPPEVRRMMTDVERAKVEGQAALERARGEHAALRSLANAARLLKDNPELMSLRTLQAVSPTGKGATLVLGQGGLTLPSAAAG